MSDDIIEEEARRILWRADWDHEPPMDGVTRPAHYCHGGLEVKDVIAAFTGDVQLPGIAAFWWGSAIKYALRWPYKACDTDGQLRDIDKAIECLTELREVWGDLDPETRDGRP